MLLPGVKAGEVMVESQAEDWFLRAMKASTRTCSFRSHFSGKPPKSFKQGKSDVSAFLKDPFVPSTEVGL